MNRLRQSVNNSTDKKESLRNKKELKETSIDRLSDDKVNKKYDI